MAAEEGKILERRRRAGAQEGRARPRGFCETPRPRRRCDAGALRCLPWGPHSTRPQPAEGGVLPPDVQLDRTLLAQSRLGARKTGAKHCGARGRQEEGAAQSTPRPSSPLSPSRARSLRRPAPPVSGDPPAGPPGTRRASAPRTPEAGLCGHTLAPVLFVFGRRYNLTTLDAERDESHTGSLRKAPAAPEARKSSRPHGQGNVSSSSVIPVCSWTEAQRHSERRKLRPGPGRRHPEQGRQIIQRSIRSVTEGQDQSSFCCGAVARQRS